MYYVIQEEKTFKKKGEMDEACNYTAWFWIEENCFKKFERNVALKNFSEQSLVY